MIDTALALLVAFAAGAWLVRRAAQALARPAAARPCCGQRAGCPAAARTALAGPALRSRGAPR